MSLRLSNIDEYISGNVRTDVIEIVKGEQKRFISNAGVDLTNYSFTTKIEYFNATVAYNTDGTITVNQFIQIDTSDSDHNEMVVVTDAANGVMEFRIPQGLIKQDIEVPIDSATPLIVACTITINRDTTAAFPTIDRETVLLLVRYAP